MPKLTIVECARYAVIIAGMRLEAKGLTRRGRSCTAIARELTGLRTRDRTKLAAALQATIDANLPTQTIYREDGSVAGFVRTCDCAQADCRKATREGRPLHATPAGFAVTLPDYHFATRELACAALQAARRSRRRRVDLFGSALFLGR
jgi:hypothetical protein